MKLLWTHDIVSTPIRRQTNVSDVVLTSYKFWNDVLWPCTINRKYFFLSFLRIPVKKKRIVEKSDLLIDQLRYHCIGQPFSAWYPSGSHKNLSRNFRQKTTYLPKFGWLQINPTWAIFVLQRRHKSFCGINFLSLFLKLGREFSSLILHNFCSEICNRLCSVMWCMHNRST